MKALASDSSAPQCVPANHQRCRRTFMYLDVHHSTAYRGKEPKCSTRALAKYVRMHPDCEDVAFKTAFPGVPNHLGDLPPDEY